MASQLNQIEKKRAGAEKSEFILHGVNNLYTDLPYRSPPVRSGYYSFVYAKNAFGRYHIGGQDYDAGPGTIDAGPGAIWFAHPGRSHSFEWHAVEQAWQITLNELFLTENVHAHVFEEFPFLLAEGVAPRLLPPEMSVVFDQLYEQIFEEYYSVSPYKSKIIGNLFGVFLMKIKEYFREFGQPAAAACRGTEIVRTFKKTLDSHYRGLLNGTEERLFRVQDYASAQNLHPNYLSNVVKSRTGKPISAWIADKTIAEAKSLLRNSSISIKEIAYQLGFTQSTHFSNYFKKHTNFSPVSFRKQAAKF